MGRNTLYETHLVTKRTDQGEWPEGGSKIEKRFGCGRETTTDIYKEVTGDEEPTCSGCSAAWGRRKLKERPDLRLESVDLDRRSQFRSLYKAFVGDALLGFVSLEHGWGKAWMVSHVGFFEGEAMRGEPAIKDVTSKESALLKIADAFAAGRMKSADQIKQETADRVTRLRQERAAREEREKARLEERDFMLETLAGMLSSDPPLSNARREAVIYAVTQLTETPAQAAKLLGQAAPAVVTED